jgi:anaerobic ribonucleoside-triphosphate reductase
VKETEIDRQIEELEKKITASDFADGTAMTMTRVSGYYRSVNNFHAGKQQEFADRKTYSKEKF